MRGPRALRLTSIDARSDSVRKPFGGRAITPTRTEERRGAAPHPGPQLKCEYLDALGVSVEAFAVAIGMDATRLGEMLAGARSLDVDAALRIARALELPAERLMRMQLRADFAFARQNVRDETIGILVDPRPQPFPERFLRGRLGQSLDSYGEASLFFQQDVGVRTRGDRYAGLHALWRGDRMRIYDGSGAIVWAGPLVHDLDARIMLPFARTIQWRTWFASGNRADLAFGPDHAAFFERMQRGDGV